MLAPARKLLFANGCSMTYGSELADDINQVCVDDAFRQANAWPGRLQKALGHAAAINWAVPSGSNDRIVRTTIQWVLGEHLQKGNSPDELLVVVGWSGPMRREFYVDRQWRQVVPYHDHENPSLQRLVEVYREVAWADFESSIRFLTEVLSLQSFLQVYAVPYLFFDAISPIQETLCFAGDDGLPYANAIDRKRYFGFDDINGCMADAVADAVPKWNGKHPSAEGHAWWSERLREYIETRQIVTSLPAEAGGLSSPVSRGARRRGPVDYVYR